jgi:hypothetical protein
MILPERLKSQTMTHLAPTLLSFLDNNRTPLQELTLEMNAGDLPHQIFSTLQKPLYK